MAEFDVKNISEEDLERFLAEYRARESRLASPGQWDPKESQSRIPPHLRGALPSEIRDREQRAKELANPTKSLAPIAAPFESLHGTISTLLSRAKHEPWQYPEGEMPLLKGGEGAYEELQRVAGAPFRNLQKGEGEALEKIPEMAEALGVEGPISRPLTNLLGDPGNFLPIGAIAGFAKNVKKAPEVLNIIRRVGSGVDKGKEFVTVSSEAKLLARVAENTRKQLAAGKAERLAQEAAEGATGKGIDPKKLYQSELRGQGLSTPTTPKGQEVPKATEVPAGPPKEGAEKLADDWGRDEWLKNRRDKVVDTKVEEMNKKGSARQRAEAIFKKGEEGNTEVFGGSSVGAAQVGKGGIKKEYEIQKPTIGASLNAKKNRPGATEGHHVLPLSEGVEDDIAGMMDRFDFYGKRLPELAADPYYQKLVKDIPVKEHRLIHSGKEDVFGKGSVGAAQIGESGIKKDYGVGTYKDLAKTLENDMKEVGDWGNRWSRGRGWVQGNLDQDVLAQRRMYHQAKAKLANLNRYFKDVDDIEAANKAQVLAGSLSKIDPYNIGNKEATQMELVFEYIHELQRRKMDNTIDKMRQAGIPEAKIDKMIDKWIGMTETADPDNAKWFRGYFGREESQKK